MSSLAVLQRRLSEARRAVQLPASAQFDLAASDVDDDALEETVAQFGGPPAGESGFGMAEVLQELLSKNPKAVPVESISTLQANLRSQGYLPTTYQPTGTYDPLTNAAFRRSQRDGMDLVRNGNHVGAQPVETFFRYLGYTVPSEVFKAIIGFGSGVVEQVSDVVTNPVETLEESGALGGAAAGAIAGGTLGGPVGALIGGAVGGGLGFLGDFFGSDSGEEDQDLLHNIWDSLSPYDEYRKDGAEHFFNLLGTVAMASGILKSVSVAKGGVGTALASPNVSLRTAYSGATQAPTPGIIAGALRSAVQGKARSGAALGAGISALPNVLVGDFEGAVEAGIKGAAVGAIGAKVAGKALPTQTSERIVKGLSYAPIRRLETATSGKIARSIYTGLSGSALSIRAFGGMGPGLSPVEEGIEDAPDIPGAIALDLTLGMAVQPSRLIPWKPSEISASIGKAASGNPMIPFARAAMREVVTDENGLPKIVYHSFRQGKARAQRFLGATESGFNETTLVRRMEYTYLQRGIDKAAMERARPRFGEAEDAWERAHLVTEERSNVIKELFNEVGDGDVMTSPTARKLVDDAMKDPIGMEDYLLSFEGRQTSLEDFAQHQKALDFLEQNQPRVMSFEEYAAQTKPTLGKLDDRDLERTLQKGYQAHIDANHMQGRLTPAVKGQYLTRQDFQRTANEYEERAKQLRDAIDVARKDPGNLDLVKQVDDAHLGYQSVISRMRETEMLSVQKLDDLTYRADELQEFSISDDVGERLRKTAELRAREVPEMTKRLQEQGMDRYIAIETGEEIVSYSNIEKLGLLHVPP